MPSSSIAVILNAAAGAAAARPHLDAELRDLFRAAGRDAEIVTLRAGQNPAEAARAASARAGIVVAGGGDGTVSGVVSGIIDSPAALGVLPLGTLNHFAKALRIPLQLAEAVAVVVDGQTVQLDVGKMNDRVFVNNCSLGVYPDILEEREALRRQGHRKWPAMAIASLRVIRRFRGMTVNIDMDGTSRSWRTPFVFVGNNEYGIDGLRIGARTRLDEGKVFVYVTPRTRARDLPMLLVQALAGRASGSGAFEIIPASEGTIRVGRAGGTRVAIDGEVVTMRTPLSYRSCPGALRAVLPRP